MVRYVDHLVFDSTRLGNPQYRTLKGTGTDLDTSGASVTLSFDKSGVMVLDESCQGLITATLTKNSLSVIHIKGLLALQTLKVYDATFAPLIDMERLPSLTTLDASYIYAPASFANKVLSDVHRNCDLYGINNGTLDLSDNAPPSGGENNLDYLALVARGWTVSIGWD